MVSMRSEKPICAPPRLSEVPERCLWNVSNVLLTDDGPLSSYLGGSFSASSFNASLLQEINGVVSLTLCQQAVSQVPQHFGSSEKQANCEGCFSSQAICSVASLHAGMSRAVHPQGILKVDVDHRHIPVWASHSHLGSTVLY